MKSKKFIYVVDSHTEGMPTRVVVGGFPHIPGKSMLEKREYVKNNLDDLVTSIIWEPRGHDDMYIAIITLPTSKEADFGVIYRGPYTWETMCGHGTIGVTTVAVETGIVEAKEPITKVTIDTPAGLVIAEAKVENGSVERVTIHNVPCFLYKEEVSIKVPGLGVVVGDVVFGGNFYFLVDSRNIKINLDEIEIDELLKTGNKIRECAIEQIKVQHPTKEIDWIDAVLIKGLPSHPKANCRSLFMVRRHVDRSPCGTGTSALMASLYYKGRLNIGSEFITESILGTLYKGKIIKETNVGKFRAIIPEITGSAWITGFNTLLINSSDPLEYGFRLRDRIVKNKI